MKILVFVALILAPFAFAAGCDSLKAQKDRAAALACSKNGGIKSYSPKLKELVVTCKDGTVHSIKWLP